MGAKGENGVSPAGRTPTPDSPPRPAGLRDIFRLPVFAVLFAGEMQSIVGDQLGRVALSVLVFERTGSAAATAATYAATLLPAVVGGLFGSRIGDHLSRRLVMIVVEILRALCFAAMAVPSVPIGGVIGLVVVAVALGPLFSASQLAYLAGELEPEQFRTGTAARMMTSQSAQVLGFVLGGVVVAAIGARAALAVDAASFALSALAVVTLLALRSGRSRSDDGAADGAYDGADSESAAPAPATGTTATPFAGLLGTPRVRTLLLLGCIVGFFVVPEGLAVPYAGSAGAGTVAVGLLLAAGAFGGALGAIAMTRFVEPTAREVTAYRMAVCCGLPLAIPAVVRHWPVAAVCWLISGVLAAYMVEVTSALVQAFPAERRSHYIGVVGALLLAAQGLGLLLFGALAGAMSPAAAIALAGLTGSAAALVVVAPTMRRTGRHAAAPAGRSTAASADRRPPPTANTPWPSASASASDPAGTSLAVTGPVVTAGDVMTGGGRVTAGDGATAADGGSAA